MDAYNFRSHRSIDIGVLIISCMCILVPVCSSPCIGADDRSSDRKSPGLVYIVIAVDTEPNRFNPWIYGQDIDLGCLSQNHDFPRVAEVMDEKWREKYQDSFGGNPKFTWFIMSHEAFAHASNGGYTVIYDMLAMYDKEITRFGDELAWHYHHADWYDLDGDGDSAWNQITTFDGSSYPHGRDIDIAERMFNHLIVDCKFLPCSFRSGWCWENNRLSRWLGDIFPFDYSANPPNAGSDDSKEPLRNQYDWSRATRNYAGYHPHARDYQKIGKMKRRIFRTVAPNNNHEWRKIFLAAREDGSRILCLTAHSYDNLQKDLDHWLGRIFHIGDSLGMSYRFATASMAGAAITGNQAAPKPELKIEQAGNQLIITAGTATFPKIPYCVAKNSRDGYFRFRPIKVAENRWTYEISESAGFECSCGICSPAGESVVVHHKDNRRE